MSTFANVVKVENRKGLDPDCNFRVTGMRGMTRTLAISLQKRLNFDDSTLGVDNSGC